MRGVLLVVAAIQLGGAFGSASAELLQRNPAAITIDLEVEVLVTVEAVVAHVRFDNQPELTLPLLARGDGVFGITTQLAPRNYVVVFEAVGPNGGLSDAVTLHELGVDLVGRSSGGGTDEAEGLTEATQRVGWLAVAFAAASLAALAMWVLGGPDEELEPGSAEEE